MKVILSRFRFAAFILLGLSAVVALPQLALGVVPVVKTVPVDPGNPSLPHTACNAAVITLKGTSDQQGANFTFDWDPGDGGAHSTGTVTDRYNVAATHTYAGVNNQTWTAVLTITDIGTGDHASANFLVILVDPCSLNAHVNIAIDEGLWYLHKVMWRSDTSGPTAGSVGAISIGGWELQVGNVGGCSKAHVSTLSGVTAGCGSFGVVDAANIQAFEVNNHLASGPASDPYTDDMARALNRLLQFLTAQPVADHTINFNAPPTCPNGSVTPCHFTFDGNSNGQSIHSRNDGSGLGYYTGGQFMDALVASGTPAAVSVTGPAGVLGKTYQDVVQDMVDDHAACQYSFGGAWIYGCNSGNDNSTSQWAAIGLIAAVRGFSLALPPIVKDANNVWATNSQQANGIYGYQSSNPIWGPYATTPAGMVQLAMDNFGRGDTRWDHAEAFIRDNFCNNPNVTPGNPFNNAVSAPKAYTYGMFSFTKSMLLHDPGGVLTPITNLQDTITTPTPPPPINWYSAETVPYDPAHGVAGQCDGVARSLVDRQGLDGGYPPTPAVPTNGFWTDHSTTGQHYWMETAWSIIMLRRTVFVSCVNNLFGKGTPSGRAVARIDLTWTGIPSATSYNVLRGTVTGGPYVQVGNTTITAFSDTSGLVNGQTYFYVLDPVNSAGVVICESNEAKVTIPATGR